MSMFQVGDKVIVNRPKVPNQIHGYNPDMMQYQGKVFTIRTVHDLRERGTLYSLKEINFSWDERCLIAEVPNWVPPSFDKYENINDKVRQMKQRRVRLGYVF